MSVIKNSVFSVMHNDEPKDKTTTDINVIGDDNLLEQLETGYNAILEQNEIEKSLSPDFIESFKKHTLQMEKSDLSAVLEEKSLEEKSDSSYVSPFMSRSPSPIKFKEEKVKKVLAVKKSTVNFSPRKGQDWTYRLSKVNPRGRGNTFGSRPPVKKKGFPQSFGESSTADMVLSANRVEIKDLQSQISFLQTQIKEVKTENKTLKNIQARQQKELKRIQEGKADIPSLLVSHKNELKAVQSTLHTTRHELNNCQKDLRSRSDDVIRKESQIRELNASLKAKDRMMEQKDEAHARTLAAISDKVSNLENELEEKNMLYTQLKNQFYRVRIESKVLHNDCESPYKSVESLFSKRTHAAVATQTSSSAFDSLSHTPDSPDLNCIESEDRKSIQKGDSVDISDSSASLRKDSLDNRDEKSRTTAAATNNNKNPDVRRANTSSQSKVSPPVKKKIDFKSAPYSARYEAPKREAAPKAARPVIKDSSAAALPKFNPRPNTNFASEIKERTPRPITNFASEIKERTPRSNTNFASEIFAKEIKERAPPLERKPPPPITADFQPLSSYSGVGSGLPNIGAFNDLNSTRYFNSSVSSSPRVSRDISKYDSLRSKYNLSNPILGDNSIEESVTDNSAPRFGW